MKRNHPVRKTKLVTTVVVGDLLLSRGVHEVVHVDWDVSVGDLRVDEFPVDGEEAPEDDHDKEADGEGHGRIQVVFQTA